MIELFSRDHRESLLRSSKGNQLKWCADGWWYKADYAGYEGLSEYIISHLLQFSTLQENEYVLYEPEEIHYRQQMMNGVRSRDFLMPGWQIITLERLHTNNCGESLAKTIWKMKDAEDRLRYLVQWTERITGIKNFGIYMNKVLTMDALFLNEDRHLHNLAVLMSNSGEFRLCPIFDNGAGLLSDTAMDYPLAGDPLKMKSSVLARTFHDSFDEQLDVSERLYGQHLRFSFARQNIVDLLLAENTYSEQIRCRVRDLILAQRRKYEYLFDSEHS